MWCYFLGGREEGGEGAVYFPWVACFVFAISFLFFSLFMMWSVGCSGEVR